MKGFFTWFKSSTKVKRWILLILIGIALCCYGFARILVQKELDFGELAIIIGLFVAGFVSVIIGIIFIQKRTLEILVQSNISMSNDKKNVDVKSLIFGKKLYENGPNIVVIGGGTGLNTVLRGIKKYTDNITAIVTISDYGRKTSSSREELNLLPLDDIKQSMVALANNEEEMHRVINHTFTNSYLKGLNFGDIYLLVLSQLFGNNAIEKSSDILKITGKVLPVTLDEIKICAELKDGTIVEEKDKISEVVYEKVTSINRVYIAPSNAVPSPGVLEAIKNADAIIIGPGSLYTNIIPNLLVKNVVKTIRESKAIKVYVSNIMTEPGQTDNYSISDHIDALIEHIGKDVIDYCLCDTGEVTPEFVRKYNKMGSDVVEQDLKNVSGKGITIIQKDMSEIKEDAIRHNPDAIASSIIELICEDIKFKDKQNNTQYVMMNSRLKQEKKIEKKNKHEKNKETKIRTKAQKELEPKFRKKSKFQEKYKDRINSIQHSDETRLKNLKLEKDASKKIGKKETIKENKGIKEIKENAKKENIKKDNLKKINPLKNHKKEGKHSGKK